MVVRVRALARRRHDLPLQLRALRRRGHARRAARREGDDVLRAADGVADAHPGRTSPPGGIDLSLRELAGAGEPLNPEVIEAVQRGLGADDPRRLRADRVLAADRQPARAAAEDRFHGPSDARLRHHPRRPGDRRAASATPEGEICVELRPAAGRADGRLHGHGDDDDATPTAFAGGRYHTGDVAQRDADGYLTYVGRADDVFKASDYRISPFELESVLIEHPAVAEAAVVPAPDELRLAVPKAFVVLVAGQQPSRELAGDILLFCREHLAPYKRIRRLEFADLPKTISGKIRRVELRTAEAAHAGVRPENEYRVEDFTRDPA